MGKTRITADTISQAMDTPAVRSALAARARLVLPRAQRIAAEAGAREFGRRLHIEEGTRPGAKSTGGIRRPYARVTADVDQELIDADKGSRQTRMRILRRAAS